MSPLTGPLSVFRYLGRKFFYVCLLSDDEISLFRRVCQLVSEVRMGDGDQGFCSFCYSSAAQFCDSVLGDDVVYVVLAGGHDGSGTYLSEEVYFQSSIDRDEVGMLRYESRVIYGETVSDMLPLRNLYVSNDYTLQILRRISF